MNLERLTQGERVVAVAGALLVIDLLFLPWHNIDVGFIEVSRTGVQSPNAFWGVMALLLAVAVLTVIALARLFEVALPSPPVPWAQAVFIAGATVGGLLLMKLVVETDLLGFGAFLGVLLGGTLAYGTWMMRSEGFAPPAAPAAGGGQARFCGTCGSSLQVGASYCPKCGEPVDAP